MKTLLAAAAALALLTAPALAINLPFGLSFDLQFGASNPSAVDRADVPNCTILDPQPGCETIIPQGGSSLVPNAYKKPEA